MTTQGANELEFEYGPGFTAFLAPEGQIEALLATNELPVVQKIERLVIVRGSNGCNPFAQNTWFDPKLVRIDSISQAANILRAEQRSWSSYLHTEIRRGLLIAEKLPRINSKPIKYLQDIPESPLGSFTLVDRNHMLYAANCSAKVSNGAPVFEEDKLGPPSRAYLKLWELFTIQGLRPKKGESCFEIGAAPGGWSYVLANLGCKVSTIDRAPLTEELMANPLISHKIGDAFKVNQEELGAIDWFFSDIICYPDKLFEFIKPWIDSGLCRNFVCTLKFQGEGHYSAIKKFSDIPGSQIVHLAHNKHELTWFLVRTNRGET